MEEEIAILAMMGHSLIDKRHETGYKTLHTLSKEFNIKFHAITNFSNIEESLPNTKIYEIKMNLDNEFKRKIILEYQYAKFAEKIVKSENISAIHRISQFSNEAGFTFLPYFDALKDYPIIIATAQASHLLFEDETRLFPLRKLFRLVTYPAFKKTLEICDVLVVVNKKTKKLYAKYISNKKIRVIPCDGVDLDKFQYSSPPDNHEILTVGSLIKRKGHEYLIKAMPKVLEEYPDAKLHILSGGPRRKFLEQLTTHLNLVQNVIFHGFVFDVHAYYRNCRVFCHPSLAEGFCDVTLEAMSSGRPVVETDTFGSEMVENGRTGILIPPADSNAIADAILRLFSDYELTCKMGYEGRKKVEREYDWNKIAKQYYDIYREVL